MAFLRVAARTEVQDSHALTRVEVAVVTPAVAVGVLGSHRTWGMGRVAVIPVHTAVSVAVIEVARSVAGPMMISEAATRVPRSVSG